VRSTRLTMLSSTADAWHLSGTPAASARRARESEPQAARKDRGAATPARGRSRCAMRAAAGKRTSKRGSKYIRKRKKRGRRSAFCCAGNSSGHEQCSSPEEALRNILPPFSSICPADLRSSIHSLASSCPSVRPSLDVAAASGATRWQAGGRSDASSRRADSGNRCRTGGAD
jgi:hypothetical protein